MIFAVFTIAVTGILLCAFGLTIWLGEKAHLISGYRPEKYPNTSGLCRHVGLGVFYCGIVTIIAAFGMYFQRQYLLFWVVGHTFVLVCLALWLVLGTKKYEASV